MKLKKIVFISWTIAFSLVTSFGGAQSLVLSGEIPMPNGHTFDLLGYFNGKITLLEEDGRNVTLHQFDDDLQKINAPSIINNSKRSYLFGYVPQDSLLTLYYKYFEDGEYIFSAVNYDPQLRLASSTALQKYIKNQTKAYPVGVSQDKNCHLITLDEAPSHNSRFIMYQANSNIVLWELADPKILNDLYDDDKRGRIITNDGSAYMLYVDGRHRYRNNYTLVALNKTGHSRLSIPLSPVPLTDIRLDYDNNQKQIIISGIYMDDGLTGQEGLLIIRLDENMKYEGEIKKIPFTRQTITDFYGQDQRPRNVLYDLTLNGCQERQDGGILIFCEQKKEVSRLSNVGRSAFMPVSTSTDFYIEDIILTSLGPNNQLEWQKILQKKQYSYDDNAIFSSYFIHANPSRLHLLYNDEIKNENTISEYIVNPFGNVERRVMFNTAGSNIQLQLRNSLQVSANSTIMPSSRKGKLRLLKITY